MSSKDNGTEGQVPCPTKYLQFVPCGEESSQGFSPWMGRCTCPLVPIIDDRLLFLLRNPLLTGHSSSVFEGFLQ